MRCKVLVDHIAEAAQADLATKNREEVVAQGEMVPRLGSIPLANGLLSFSVYTGCLLVANEVYVVVVRDSGVAMGFTHI